MMQTIADNLAASLSMLPDPLLPAANMGMKKPATVADLPAISLVLEMDGLERDGIGRVARSGEIVVKNTALVTVSQDPELFSPDLQAMRLRPLPLRKNPSTRQTGLNAYEVELRNITEPGQKISYRQVLKPSHPDEFTLDPPRARVIFGGPQIPADTLEVTHWTVTWRDDIIISRYKGRVFLEIWAENFSEIDALSRKLQTRLAVQPGPWRQQGFLMICPNRMESAENFRHTPASGTSFSVWRQQLVYGFAFEAEEGAELSEGLPIKKISVDMDQELPETFTVT
jgi:hypothetical protein